MISKCEFCNFNQDPKVWTINLYSCTSYKYEGKKYFLDIEYPLGDMTKYPDIKAVEVNYCPMCGKKLNIQHKVFRGE
jgi:hypothetical protein